MKRDEFRRLLRDLLANIYDVAVLEEHPLNALLPRPEPAATQAENLRRFIWEGIEALRPDEADVRIDSLEWRYYLILRGRYIEGASVAELQKRLALGERQERRLHGRALIALENILWNRLLAGQAAQTVPQPVVQAGPSPEEDFDFQLFLEPLHVDRVIGEVASLCRPRFQAQGGRLEVQVPRDLPPVKADRVILRQILLDIFNRILQIGAGEPVEICGRTRNGSVTLEVQVAARQRNARMEEEHLLGSPLQYWAERMKASLSVEAVEPGHDGVHESRAVRYLLALPLANQSTLLVVDDHEPAIRIVQRFLQQTGIQVQGIMDPAQVLPVARALLPVAILLDVMMPAVDGWEILQQLKSDPETRTIPVIVCSVWDQPELAFSLGADGFIKKPISQSALLGELTHLNLLDTLAGSSPAGS